MKKSSLIILLFLFPLLYHAQDLAPLSDSPKHELGMNLFSVINIYPGKSQHSSITPGDPFYKTGNNIFPGIYYKYHSGKNALRLSLDYFQKAHSGMGSITFDPYTSFDYSYAGIMTNHDFKIGYQRSFGTRRVIPFIFSDLVFNYNKLTAAQNIYLYTQYFPVSSVSLPYYIEQYLFGISPGGGVKIRLSKNVVLTYEFSAIFSYSRSHEILRGSKYWATEFDWRVNPIKMLGFGVVF